MGSSVPKWRTKSVPRASQLQAGHASLRCSQYSQPVPAPPGTRRTIELDFLGATIGARRVGDGKAREPPCSSLQTGYAAAAMPARLVAHGLVQAQMQRTLMVGVRSTMHALGREVARTGCCASGSSSKCGLDGGIGLQRWRSRPASCRPRVPVIHQRGRDLAAPWSDTSPSQTWIAGAAQAVGRRRGDINTLAQRGGPAGSGASSTSIGAQGF